jgi:Carboxypeptidase regulatory-like domain/TonB dependent receptor
MPPRNFARRFYLTRLIDCGNRALLAWVVFSALLAWGSAQGSISGSVKDPVDRGIPDARVTIRETTTGFVQKTQTDSAGHYVLPVLPVGNYELHIEAPGFKAYRRLGITLDAASALTIDATLPVGSDVESIDVTDDSVHVETSSTQMGETISARQITAVPLNGRSFTDLLSLQPGVAPGTSITADTVQDVGATVLQPSGTLNPGTISVNGQREFANAFVVNGSNAQEDVNSGTSVVPNLDSIAEFRIITNNFDAEYGEYSGGQILVVTKSGTNQLHGSMFEFLRNTDFDARNYFSPTRGTFRQNQFGGTLGGPIRHNKLFLFADYQGTLQTQGIDTGDISVPSNTDRVGNLADQASSLTGAVTGPYLASLLSQKLGYSVTPGERYYSANCVLSSQCVFPGALIPIAAWSGPAQNLLHYIPFSNTSSGTFSTSSYDQTVHDHKGAVRLDGDTHWGLISAYYFPDDFSFDNPYPTAQSGANVPGFNALSTGRAQLFTVGNTKILNANSVSEFHLSYLRNENDLGQPLGGRGVSLVSQGFVTPQGTASIVPLDPRGQSVENVVFNGYSIGAAANELKQANNTYELSETVSRVRRNHSIKFGGDLHFDEVNAAPIAQFNGNFIFAGSETGNDFADFLIGVPSQYNQSQLNPFYARNRYLGLFAQDSWKIRPTLNLNYGLRWDRIEPWTEKYNEISTFVPERQSVVFPTAPEGFLFPTDPGVPRTLAPVSNLGFTPRVGVAWSPHASEASFLGKLLGGAGTTSIRTGFGKFYSAIEALSISVLAANSPYGTTYTSPAPPLFSDPFITASNGQNFGQPFPYTFAPRNASASHPDPSFDWSSVEPISGIPAYDIHNRIPYSNQWMASVERQFGSNTVVNASYVGNVGRRLRVLVEANPGNPALCLSLSQQNQVAPGSATCGPFGENNVFTTASGQTLKGTRGPLGPNFGSNAYQSTIGVSDYNALELSARHTSGRLQFFASYTYSKALDESSSIGDEVSPFNPGLSYALSSFDVRHNFVFSYDYELPIAQLLHASSLWTNGWRLSGITRFSTGFPVSLVNNGDNSLLGTNPNGVNNSGIDLPDYNGEPLLLNHDPRDNTHNYFDTADFSMNVLGTPGNAKRRFFYGPGSNNFDMALAKNLPLTESKIFLFRLEAFNLFNHAQFFGPASVDGDIGSSTFGKVISAAPGRVLQAALKFSF